MKNLQEKLFELAEKLGWENSDVPSIENFTAEVELDGIDELMKITGMSAYECFNIILKHHQNRLIIKLIESIRIIHE